MNSTKKVCLHCGQRLTVHTDPDVLRGTWIHAETQSVYCDLSGTTKAAPRYPEHCGNCSCLLAKPDDDCRDLLCDCHQELGPNGLRYRWGDR